jgi:hypothetical protein
MSREYKFFGYLKPDARNRLLIYILLQEGFWKIQHCSAWNGVFMSLRS